MSSPQNKVKIPTAALTWRFSRSSGPGGQHVNTSDTRVELICDLSMVYASESTKQRIIEKLGNEFRVVASSERSQTMNRRLAMEKLVDRLEKAAKIPHHRRATKPTWGSVQNRLQDKKRNAQRKSERRIPPSD